MSYKVCKAPRNKVLEQIIRAKLLLHNVKCVWTPEQCLEEVGLIWDLQIEPTIIIPDGRVRALLQSIETLLGSLHWTRASVIGRIIAMSPVLGNVTKIMTRFVYGIINKTDPRRMLSWTLLIAKMQLKNCIFGKVCTFPRLQNIASLLYCSGLSL